MTAGLMYGSMLRPAVTVRRPPGPRWLLVKVGAVQFAIREELVRQLEPNCACLPLPLNAPHWVKGWFLLQGRAVPAIDLGVRLGLDAVAEPCPAIVVALAGGQNAALFVSRLNETAAIRECEVRHHRASMPYSPFVTGVWRGRSRPCFLLDMKAVLPETTFDGLWGR